MPVETRDAHIPQSRRGQAGGINDAKERIETSDWRSARRKRFIERSYPVTVLITGGAGFIGGHTVLAFLDRGETPIVLDDLSTGNRAAVPPAVPFFAGDAGDTELVLRLIERHRVDAILHFAAKIVVPESVADPLDYYLSNTVKTHALLQAAVRGNVKHFVFSSSAAVYGNPSITPVCETADPAPLSPYGRSKLMSEYMLVDASAASDLRHVALRYFTSREPTRRGAMVSRRPVPRI
jgi:UDP-glucose 4-epimerase